MRQILIGALLLMLLISCKHKPEVVALKHYDDSFTHIVKGKGELPKPGQYTVFSLKVVGDNGKVFTDLTAKENWTRYRQPDSPDEFRPDMPVDEILTLLVVGDSVTWVYKVDSLTREHPMLEGATELTYGISIKEIVSGEEMLKRIEGENAEMQTKMAEVQGKEPIVAEKVSELLKAYKSKSLKDLQKTASGLEYSFINKASGPKPKSGQLVKVHYYGVLASDGKMFDNSFGRGEEFGFTLGMGEVIPGWDEALALMPQGSEAVFFIPYDLAYGEEGRPPVIPAKATLMFYIEYL